MKIKHPKIKNIRIYYRARNFKNEVIEETIDLKMVDYKADILKTATRDTYLAAYAKNTPTYLSLNMILRKAEIFKENIYIENSIFFMEEVK